MQMAVSWLRQAVGTQGEGSVLVTKGGGGTQAKGTVRATRRTMDNTG